MLDHHAVKTHPRRHLCPVAFFAVLKFGNTVGTLRMFIPLVLRLLGQLVRSSTGWTKLGVKRPATPSGLDDQDGLLELFLHRDTEGEFRPNLATVFSGTIAACTKACGQFPQTFAVRAAVVRPCQIRHPNLVTYARRSIRIAHLFEQRCRGWIFTDVVKRPDFRMSLHVRLASENEYLQWLGKTVRGRDAQHCDDEAQ